MTLPEVHYSLQKVEQYIRKQPDNWERVSVLKSVHRAEYALERHLKRVFRENPGNNAFLKVAKFYRKIGEVDLAIEHYKKAIECLERDGYRLAGQHNSLSDEASECFYELQSCHLAVWQVKAAAKVARLASRAGRCGDYITEDEIGQPWIYLRCAEHTLVFLARDLLAKITRQKGKF